MGTNAIIMVVGNKNETNLDTNQSYNQAFNIHRHRDGYPQQTLSQIIKACAKIEPIMSRRHNINPDYEVEHPTPEIMAVLIQAETICMARSASVTVNEVDFCAEDCGNDDVDWFYVVDCNLLAVNVFSVRKLKERYSNHPRGHMTLGFYDLVNDIQNEISTYIEPEKAAAEFFKLKQRGDQLHFWKVNQTPDIYLKSIHSGSLIKTNSGNNLVVMELADTEGMYAF